MLALPTATSFALVASPPSMMQRSAVVQRTGVSTMGIEKIKDKNVWAAIANAGDCTPGTINSGFKFGQEVAIVCGQNGQLAGLSNKMPPFGQPTTFANFVGKDEIEEPVSRTRFNYKTGKQVGPWCPAAGIGFVFRLLTEPQDMAPVKVRKSGNKVEALLNVNAKAQYEQGYWRGILDAQGKTDGGYY